MKSFEGYLKLKLGDSYVLLAGGGHRHINDFILPLNTSPAATISTGRGGWQPLTGRYVFQQYWTDSSTGSNTADFGIFLDGNLTANMVLDGYYYTLLGYKVGGKDDNSVLLAGGGTKALSDFKIGDYLKNTTDTFTGLLTLNGNSDLPLFIKGGTGGYQHGIIIKGAEGWSGILLGDSNQGASHITSNGYWIGNNEGTFCITRGGAGNGATSLYCNGTNWYVNTNLIRHSGDTYVSSNKGYIGGSEITYVNNSGGADHLNYERVSDIHATTGWRMFTTTDSYPSNGPVSGRWMLGLTVLPNNDINGYRNILAFVDCGSNNELWIQTQGGGTWGNWRKILDSSNYSSYALPLTGGTMSGGILLGRSGGNKRGLGFYDYSFTAWQIYMNPPGSNLSAGYLGGILTVPSGSYVTSWAMRFFIEDVYGYGWTWESGNAYTSAPTIVAELRSSDGTFKTSGNHYAPNYYTTSDSRKKKDIKQISNSIYQFKLKDLDTLLYGYIAQELEKTNPELVDSSSEYKTVNYNSAICYNISKIENTMKAKIIELELRLEKLELAPPPSLS